MFASLLLNKYVLYGIAILLLFGAIVTTYLTWKHSIEQEALLNFNNQQLQVIVEQQKKLDASLNKLNIDQTAILKDVADKNNALNDKLNSIDVYLKTPSTIKEDKSSSNILKNTFKSLSGQP